MKQISVGIIGAGYIAQYHLKILAGIKQVSVKAICDISISRALSLKKQFNIPHAYNSIEEFLAGNDLSVVHILVPPDFHFEITRKVLEKGINVLLEKPMAENSEHCRQLNALAKEKGVQIGINQNSLYHPLFLKMVKDVEKGLIGPIRQVASFQSGPLGQLDFGLFSHWMFHKSHNVLLEQAPHPVAQVINLLGDVQKIQAHALDKRTLGFNQLFYGQWQAIAKCEKGAAYINLAFGKDHYLNSWIEANGQDGSIRVDLLKNLYLIQSKSIFPDFFDPIANALKYGRTVLKGGVNFIKYLLSKLGVLEQNDVFYLAMKNSIKGFYESLADGQPIPVSGEDGEKIVRFCERWIDCANPTPNKVLEITPNTEKPKDPKVLITGATGFLGKNLLKHLVDKGVAVRALVRSEKGLSKLFYHPLVEVYKGNLLDEKSLDGATKGVEYIYHLAHALGNTWDEFKEINIKSTRCLAEAGLKQGIKNFIFTSTIATYYTGDLESPHVDETMAIDPEPEKRNFYARSKMILEEMLLAMHKKDKLPLVLFRPAVVLGEGGTPYHPGIGQWSRDNVCAYWGWGKNDLPFVLVDDISSALIKVMETEGLDGEIFNLAGDVRFSAREYIDYIRKSSGRNIMSFPYPMRLCFISESLKYFVKFIGRSHQGTLLSYRDLKNRSILADFDNTKAKQLLSWQPCTDKRHFIQVTIENLF